MENVVLVSSSLFCLKVYDLDLKVYDLYLEVYDLDLKLSDHVLGLSLLASNNHLTVLYFLCLSAKFSDLYQPHPLTFFGLPPAITTSTI